MLIGGGQQGIVWYVCNYDSLNNQGCNRVEMDEAGGVLAGACPGRGGWIAIDAWNKMYGRDGAGREICNGSRLLSPPS